MVQSVPQTSSCAPWPHGFNDTSLLNSCLKVKKSAPQSTIDQFPSAILGFWSMDSADSGSQSWNGKAMSLSAAWAKHQACWIMVGRALTARQATSHIHSKGVSKRQMTSSRTCFLLCKELLNGWAGTLAEDRPTQVAPDLWGSFWEIPKMLPGDLLENHGKSIYKWMI